MAVDITVLYLLLSAARPSHYGNNQIVETIAPKNLNNNNNKCFCEAAVWYHLPVKLSTVSKEM